MDLLMNKDAKYREKPDCSKKWQTMKSWKKYWKCSNTKYSTVYCLDIIQIRMYDVSSKIIESICLF